MIDDWRMEIFFIKIDGAKRLLPIGNRQSTIINFQLLFRITIE